MAYKTVTHVLFDLDGLLIDSEELYTKAFNSVLSQYGYQISWELKASMLGFQAQECAEKIIDESGLALTPAEFLRQCDEVFPEIFADVQLMPGAQKLVEHLDKHGVPMALATSSGEDSVKIKMQNHKRLLEMFHHITMGSSDPAVTRGKPDPIIFQVCASHFDDKLEPQNCLVFEDAVNGVKAAVAAEMQVIAVPDPRIDRGLLTEATLVLDSLEDFKPELFGLPAYDE